VEDILRRLTREEVSKKERKVRKGGQGGKGALFGNVWIPRR